MKKEIYIQGISILLLFLFAYTGVSKLLTLSAFKEQLISQPLTSRYPSVFMVAIPFIELSISLLLIIPRTRRQALLGSFLLMTLFTFYVAYMLFILPENRLPCACGGIIKQLSWHQHLVFNSIFTLLAFIALLMSWSRSNNNKGSQNEIFQLSSQHSTK